MERVGPESMEALVEDLRDAGSPRPRPVAQDAKDTEWVIERIQESFDSRAR